MAPTVVAKAKESAKSAKAIPSNGTSSKDKKKELSSGVPKTTSLLPSIVLVVIAFICGIVTPPTLRTLSQRRTQQEGVVDDDRSSINSSSSSYVPLPYTLPKYTPCTQTNLDDFLHDEPVSGLHIICIEPMFTNSDGIYEPFPQWTNEHDRHHILNVYEGVLLTVYKHSHAATPMKETLLIMGKEEEEEDGDGGTKRLSVEWSKMKELLYEELGLIREGKLQQPWAVFTPSGERVIGERDVVTTNNDGVGSSKHVMNTIIASGMIVAIQGGNWLWPGVREGFQRTIELGPIQMESDIAAASGEGGGGSRNVTIETLSLKPLVLSIKGFLSEEECDYIAKKAEPSLQYSGVSLKDADKGKAASNWRTSQSTFLSAHDDSILMDIEYRTASLTRVPRNHQEYAQVLRYGHTEKYDAHHDYFDPASYKSDPNTMALIEHGKRNRFATVFWYLTSVDDGGHTIFPRAFGQREVSFSDCSIGLKVKPQKGKVIIFYSLDASGARDDSSLHGACPVGEGNIKWAANKWIWNAPMNYVR
jgi:prolyl 4-hydroxylase